METSKMSINADISELGDLMDGIAPLDLGDKPMTGHQFIKAYQFDEAEKESELPIRKYNREELLKYRDCSLAKTMPALTDPEISNMSCWQKGFRSGEDEFMKRRSADPRERARREGDGIVLSPQRANFNNGCAVVHQKMQPPNQPAHRRIGSGRLLRRDWDGDESLIFRPSHSRDERMNGFPEGFGRHGDRLGGDDGRFRQRLNDRNNFDSRNNAPAPEWFTSGPTSQNDTIDLHGFENDIEEPHPSDVKEKKEPDSENVLPPKEEPKQVAAPEIEENKTAETAKSTDNFNIDDILDKDGMASLFVNMNDDATFKSSKFSQFFPTNGQVPPDGGSVCDPHMMSVMNARRQVQPNESGLALVELFRREQQRQQSGPSLKDLAATGKVRDVAELEARYRQLQLHDELVNDAAAPDDINPDVQAFILRKARQEHVPRPDVNVLFHMQLQKQLAERNQAILLGKFIVPQHFQQLPADLQAVIANAKPTVEICTTPEFQNCLAALLQGRISIPNVVGQLISTHDVRIHEILTSVLNLTLINKDPMTLQQILQQNGLHQQHQQGQQHRVPSSLELRAHTSNIMQTALIKRKLEEQSENFKKRESLRSEALAAASGRSSPIPPGIGQQHGSTMSFTPTAVLRKMTADDKDARRVARGALGVEGIHSPTLARSPIPFGLNSEGPMSPISANNAGISAMGQWGALRAITKACDYDPAIVRANWAPSAQGSAGVPFAFRPPMAQQLPSGVASNAPHPQFTFPPPVNRMPPQFRPPVPVAQGEVLPGFIVSNVGQQDEFRPMWNTDPYAQVRQHPRPPPQDRIISVEELERKARMQRF